MIKNYLEHISYPDYDEYDPDEIIELVGLPSGVFLETIRKNYSIIQHIANWSEKLKTYTFRDKDYSRILYLLELDKNVITSHLNYVSDQLKKIGIKNDFIKDRDGIIIYGDIKLNHQKYQKFPIKIHQVEGDFSIIHSALITLENCPSIISGNFNCSFNKLKSLKGGPNEVGLIYDCSHNDLKTLNGSPSDAESFNCSYNELINLDHSPSFVTGDFNCSHNKIENLINSPFRIGGSFDCRYNQLDNLNGLPIGIKEILSDHNPMRGM